MDIGKKTTIQLFEENELNVGKLYKLYSQKIPGHKKFWMQLSLEEGNHAADINSTFQKNGDNLFKESKFTRGILKYVMDFVEEKIKESREKKISHTEALNIALRVEQSILEKKCFEIFVPTDDRLKEVMERLNKETEKHVNMLRKEFKRQ